MTNVEGFLGIVIMIELAAGLIGCAIVSIGYFILEKINNRPFRLAVLLAGMAVSMMYVGRGDAPMMLTLSLAFGIPLAVLVPPLCFPERIGGCPGIYGVLKCYAIIWVAGAILPFLFVVSGRRAHGCTPVNARYIVCRHLTEKIHCNVISASASCS